MTSALNVEHLTPTIGSLVHDIDLADPAVVDRHGPALRDLLFEREVIFFHNQELTAAQQARVAELFGHVPAVKESTLQIHPDHPAVCILESKGKPSILTDRWHSDLSYHPDPPLATCLYARVVPESGGDTMFASMTAAYQSLHPKLQAYLEELQVVHNWEDPAVVQSMLNGPNGEAGYKRRRELYPPANKPAVLRHPVTGKPVLYVNALYNKDIVGLRTGQSSALIRMLAGLAEEPELQVRFRWKPNSLAIWDNLATQHYAVSDYHPAHRKMHRIVIRQN